MFTSSRSVSLGWLVLVFVLFVDFPGVVQSLDDESPRSQDEIVPENVDALDASPGVVDRSSDLLASSLLFGVLSEFVSGDGPETGKCNSDVQTVLDGIRKREVWALKSKILIGQSSL